MCARAQPTILEGNPKAESTLRSACGVLAGNRSSFCDRSTFLPILRIDRRRQLDRQQGAEMTNISKRASERATGCAVAVAAVAIVVFAVAARAQAPSNSAQELPPLIRSTKGPDLFRAYCASCHGLDGKGDGPAASALKAKVPNLTLLAKNNGGTFPTARARRTITGEDVMASHGSREMPIWGPIFHQVEEDIDRGNVRIENLLEYLQSIQVSK